MSLRNPVIVAVLSAILVSSAGVTIHAQQAADMPQGVQVWNGDILAPYQDLVPPDATAVFKPVTIVGTPNGSFSGKVIVGSTGPIKGLRARMSDLDNGKAKIPASAIQVRYPRYMRRGGWNSVARAVVAFDDLEETPPGEVPLITSSMKPGHYDIANARYDHAYQPIWVTVAVPADATPGEYRGELEIAIGDAQPFRVPVRVKVCGWRLPDPQDYLTFVEFIQSPESVAMQYEVPLWSNEHFDLMAKSLRLLGRIGNRSVYIPLICETNQGNDESMVRWIREADRYRYDFTVMEKYLDAVEKNMSRPRNVVLYVWDIFLEGGSFEIGDDEHKTDLNFLPEDARKDRQSYQGKGPTVSCLDRATGKLTKLELPQYSDPKARALWKPLLEELRERLNKRGLESAMTLGAACDSVPSKETISLFKELAPGVPWMEHTHGFYGAPQQLERDGAKIKYVALVFYHTIPKSTNDFHEWKEGETAVVWYPRGRPHNSPITTYRLTAEQHTSGKMRGFGRVGADFWPVMKDKRGRMVGRICQGRFPKSLWRNLDIRQTLIEPGPNGAISTVRFEMMCEGVQENEARLFVEAALVKKRIDRDLATRCREILAEREQAIRAYNSGGGRTQGPSDETYARFVESGWQERSEKLFELAAEVAEALKTQ